MAIVGVPTAVAILAFEPPQTGTAVLALLLLAGAAAGFGEATPLWYIERGWAVLLAGGFAISTTLAPGRPILDRSLMGVAIAGGTVGAMGALRPDLPAALDRHVSGQFDRVLAMYDSRAFGGPVVDAAVRQFVGLWEAVYPAMLVLASVSALALCVYLLGRIRGEEAALPPLRHFRFSTHLVWVLILGLALLVLPAGDWAHRAGGNVVTVMGGLYLLRGRRGPRVGGGCGDKLGLGDRRVGDRRAGPLSRDDRDGPRRGRQRYLAGPPVAAGGGNRRKVNPRAPAGSNGGNRCWKSS